LPDAAAAADDDVGALEDDDAEVGKENDIVLGCFSDAFDPDEGVTGSTVGRFIEEVRFNEIESGLDGAEVTAEG
jgi:hypothetical protein